MSLNSRSVSDLQCGESWLDLPLNSAAPSESAWTHLIVSYDIGCQYIHCAMEANFRLPAKGHSPKVPTAHSVRHADENYDDLPDLEPVEVDTAPSYSHRLRTKL
ncbi:hypothetical protein C8R43DRAFT_1137087 [Mycena crocata]|nr:hypothetical protein C8R43DRAFT_1137087 [Mycena crocata]